MPSESVSVFPQMTAGVPALIATTGGASEPDASIPAAAELKRWRPGTSTPGVLDGRPGVYPAERWMST